MKKIFLIVAILMLATPAFAVTVDITARAGEDANKVEIWYEVTTPVLVDCNDGNRPRAFGLNVSVTDGNIVDVCAPFVGEGNSSATGFGIFPGTIEIAGGEVTNYDSESYTLVAPSDDPGASGTGLDTNTIVAEMGSLYTGANCPDPCAMLFYIVVNMDCNVNVAGNAARTGTGSPARGVVLESLGAVTVNWPSPYPVTGVSRFVPNVVNQTQADANDAIVAEDLVVGSITYVCDLTISAGNVTMTEPEAGIEVPQGTEVNLWVSLGQCDFGDADDPTYPTLLASDGARHIIGGVNLGANVDAEADGQPNATATGDDIAGATPDDEDGVLIGILAKGVNNNVTVIASGAGYLNAWLDKNADGDWADAGEQIFTDTLLAAGGNALTVAVGCGDTSGPTVSRWRFTSYIPVSPDANYTGLETDGEVEDHNVVIACHVPDVCGLLPADACDAIEAGCFVFGSTSYECNDFVDACDVIRADPPYCTYPECGTVVDIVVSTGPCATYPACWDWVAQCEGDSDGDDQDVDTFDFTDFKNAFGKNYWDHYPVDDLNPVMGEYNPCSDSDKDGDVDTFDFTTFKANFGGTGYGGCPADGDPHGVYLPGSVKP